MYLCSHSILCMYYAFLCHTYSFLYIAFRVVQIHRHSFRPLGYVVSKEVETKEVVWFGVCGLQIAAEKYFGGRLQPACSISDHSDGLRAGMALIRGPAGLGLEGLAAEEAAHANHLPHFADWAHIATYYRKGRLLSKQNPYYGEVWCMLKAVHFAGTLEMKEMLESLIFDVWDDWEENGEVLLCTPNSCLLPKLTPRALPCSIKWGSTPQNSSGTNTSFPPGMCGV
jgi:hypothetical protein